MDPSSPPSEMSFSRLFHTDLWNKNMDPRVINFPFMLDGFPWRIIAICAFYIFITKFWRPVLKGVDLKPILLIQNGFAFGVHGAGLVLALVLSDMGRDGFDCTPLKSYPWTEELTFDYVRTESTLHVTAVFLLLRIYLLSESMCLMLIRGKSPSNWRIANEVILLIFTFIGVKYIPGGPSLFFGMTYLAFYTFTYGFYTLKLGYGDYKDVLRKWKFWFIYMKFAWSFLNLSHFLFLVMSPTCQKNPIILPVSLLEFIYASGTLVSAIDGYRKHKRNERRISHQMISNGKVDQE